MDSKILVFERNVDYAKKLISLLTNMHGYEIVHVNTELAVVRELASGFFDLMIAGIHLEREKEGLKLIEVLLEEKRDITVTPMMVISDIQDPAFVRRCVQAGVQDYLLYPENPVDVLPRMKKVLDKSGGVGEMLVRVSVAFLGPAARMFLEQQSKEKLKLAALTDLRRDQLPELLKHIVVIIKPVLKEKMVQFLQRLRQVFGLQQET